MLILPDFVLNIFGYANEVTNLNVINRNRGEGEAENAVELAQRVGQAEARSISDLGELLLLLNTKPVDSSQRGLIKWEKGQYNPC